VPENFASPSDLSSLSADELGDRVTEVREKMRPRQAELDKLRAERDVLLTEIRRRERLGAMTSRRDIKEAMRAGQLLSVGELVANTPSGTFDDFVYNLRTGGEVRLGFPGARSQTITFTDGRQVAQARELAESSRLFLAGWDFGAPGKPGIRIHFPGTRTERLVDPGEVFVRPVHG